MHTTNKSCTFYPLPNVKASSAEINVVAPVNTSTKHICAWRRKNKIKSIDLTDKPWSIHPERPIFKYLVSQTHSITLLVMKRWRGGEEENPESWFCCKLASNTEKEYQLFQQNLKYQAKILRNIKREDIFSMNEESVSTYPFYKVIYTAITFVPYFLYDCIYSALLEIFNFKPQ